MYSKEESKKIRQEFWTSFGKNFPRKWVLYNTRIKDLSLKFSFTRKTAEVSIDIEPSDEIFRSYYFDKFQSLKTILKDQYLPDAQLEKNFQLENGKVISRIFVRKEDVNIHNRRDWVMVQKWLYEQMDRLEAFFKEYREFISE